MHTRKRDTKIPHIAPQRIQKLLANAGYGSRRTIEQWITEKLIQVNGVPAVIGQIIKGQDQIEIKGRRIDLSLFVNEHTRVLLYNKPEGEICSHKSFDGKKTVFHGLPKLKQGKWVSIGRLDVNTSGLLLFTNDGNLAHKLMHPSFEIERRYLVRVMGKVNEEMLTRLKEGVKLDEGYCHFSEIYQKETSGINQWFIVVLKEGKYREVRRLWESQDCLVSRLVRIKYGNIELPRRLRKGKWQELPEDEVRKLIKGTPNRPVLY